MSLVERKTGYVLVGKLSRRTTTAVNRRLTQLIRRQARPVRTITVDNGTEFHGYATLERTTGTRFYFATPHHAWERRPTKTPTASSGSISPKARA